MANVQRIKALREFLTRNPQQHNQEEWGRGNEYGTTACAAGWAVLLFDENVRARFDQKASRTAWGYGVDLIEFTDVPARAQRLLDLTDPQATEVFYSRSLNQVKTALRAIEENSEITRCELRELIY